MLLKRISKLRISTLPSYQRQFSVHEDKTLDPPPHPGRPSPPDYTKLRIYKDFSTFDLLNMLAVNTLCTKDLFVDNCHHFYRLSNKVLGKSLTNAIVSNTMGRIFTCGDSIKTVDDFVNHWKNKDVSLIIDYSNEAIPGQVITSKDLDDNAQVFCDTIPIASKGGLRSGVALKVSAMVFHAVALKANIAQVNLHSVFSKGFGNLSESLTSRELMDIFKEQKVEFSFSDFSEFLALFLNKTLTSESQLDNVKITKFEWLNSLHAYYIRDANKNANKILLQLTKLTDTDLAELEQLEKRLEIIFSQAEQSKCIVLVDAEQTYMQATIDSFAIQFGDIYNKSKKPIVLNTFQNYLKATKERINYELERCKALNIPFAIKMVRGAYMIEERRLAKELNYSDPIHDDVEATHDNYNSNMAHIIKNWTQDSYLMIASHNEYSNTYGKELVEQYNINSDKGTVAFVQLLGLADYITYSNGVQGLDAAKYIPFGPIPILIPYLIRRAQESKQMLKSTALQRSLVFDELKKRLKGI